MQHFFRRRHIVVSALVLAILAGTVWALGPGRGQPPLPPAATSDPAPTPDRLEPAGVPAGEQSPERAATAAVAAFYTVDYQNYDGWLAGLRSVSTADGYAIVRHSIAPAVWPELQRARTVTPASAVDTRDGGLLLSGNSPIGGPWQIRQVTVRIDSAHLWPTMTSGSFDIRLMLAREDGGWRFVSFVTPEQLAALKGQDRP